MWGNRHYQRVGYVEILIVYVQFRFSWYNPVKNNGHYVYHFLQRSSLLSKNIKFNRLTPKDPYMGRTAPLSSKRYILYIYSTNIGTEYFKHALYSPFFLFKMQFVS